MGRGRVPRFSFTTWLLCLQCLKTLDRLRRWGITTHRTCILCQSHDETMPHLFFKCPAISDAWKAIKKFYKICCLRNSFIDVLDNLLTNWKAHNTYLVRKLILTRFINHKWPERNSHTFLDKGKGQHRLLLKVLSDVNFKEVSSFVGKGPTCCN